MTKNPNTKLEQNKTIKVVQHNVLSWNLHKYALSNIYSKLDPDVILINAHGIKAGQEIKIYNYNIYKKNKLDSAHSGSAIAVKRGLIYRIKEDYYSDLITVTIETNLGPVEIATTYIPPRTGYLHYPDFHSLFTTKHPVYFLGDLNARHRCLGHSNNNITGTQIATLIDRNHVRHEGPDFPTYITNARKTAPDIILTNNSTYHNTIAEIGPATPSDHIPILYKISTNPLMIPIPPRPAFKKADWEEYKRILEKIPITDLNNSNKETIEKQAEYITGKIQEASKATIPETKFRTIPHFHSTIETRQVQAIHDELLDRIRQTGPDRNTYRQIRILRQRLIEEYKRLRTEMWDELIRKTDMERNSKEFWISVRRMMGGNSKIETRYLKDHNGQDIYDDKGREEIFRRYWSTVFKISAEENEQFDKRNDSQVNNFISDRKVRLLPKDKVNIGRLEQETILVNNREVKNIINSFKQRAPGNDRITKYHLTHLPENIITNIKNIYNASLSIGYFPKLWKISQMVLIPKAGKSPTQHINYRPISLLSILGKGLEKIINKKLIDKLNELELNNPRQHGFRKDRGTETAIGIIYELIATAKANKLRTNLILRDISKAFDKVWHEGLIYKLISGKLPNYIIRIIFDYLQNRKAQIKINNYIGPSFNLCSGVPQGGCLSPTLFNYYTHDLPPPISNSEYIAYADDITQIITYPGTEHMLTKLTEKAVEEINTFENKWKIKTNSSKFQVIPIGRRKTMKIKINNTEIQSQKEGKALGVKIHTEGFSKHANERIQLAKNQLSKLFRFKDMSQNNKRKIYIAMIKSSLEYSPIIQHIQNKTMQRKMQIVQNKSARIITGIRKREQKTNQYVNNRARLEPLNMSIHKRVIKIWEKIEQIAPQETLEKLELNPNREYNNRLPSSRGRTTRAIEPIY